MPVFDYTSYLPAVSEIPAETLLDARTAVEAVIRQSWPDVDTRPGSFFGDNHVSQQAVGVAAQKIAAERLANDLDTNQLRQGVVFNCAVATAWLGNFSLLSRDGNPCRGLVRLTFVKDTFLAACVDNRLAMPRGIQFLEGETNICRPVLSRPGSQNNADFYILSPGFPPTSDATVEFYSSETPEGTIIADIPVTAVSVAADGVSILTDSTVPGLSGLMANGAFTSGFPASTVKDIAARVPYLFHGSSLSDKAGAVGFVYREFPWAECVSAVTNGDNELTRAGTSSLFLLQEPCLDLYVRSGTVIQDTIRVRLSRLSSEGPEDINCFYGPVSFMHVPISLVSVSCPDAASLTVEAGTSATAGSAAMQIISSGPSGQTPPRFIRTASERFTVGISLHADDIAAAQRIDTDGEHILVDVTYTYDPALAQVVAMLESTENTPVGVSLVVRGFYPVEFTDFQVNYFRKAGTAIRAGTAKSEIVTAVNALGYPDLLTTTPISDSMLFAGAASVRDVSVENLTHVTVAHRVLATAESIFAVNNTEDWAILLDETVAVTSYSGDYDQVTGSVVFEIGYFDIVVGQRNRRYLLDDAALTLKEVTS